MSQLRFIHYKRGHYVLAQFFSDTLYTDLKDSKLQYCIAFFSRYLWFKSRFKPDNH